MQVLDYKCPNCGSGMNYDSESGKLSCQSCGRKDDIELIPDPLKKFAFSEQEVNEYHCNSCGAVIITEVETSATVCSFCGTAVVLADRLTGNLAPALVVPFSINKNQAMEAFRKWCRNGLLTPKGFVTADRIKGITGMYVPFWLYDLHNRVEVQGSGTKVRVYTKGDYRYTETQHFDVYRKLQLDYTKIPVDASEKMNDALMDRLEPFPYDQLKSFKTAYLTGYVAEKYNYDDHQLLPRANEKIARYIESEIAASAQEYTSVNFMDKKIHNTYTNAQYCLLPVWVVHYDYNKLEYTFAMNGQTGKVVGKPPISKGKIFKWFSGVTLTSFIVMKAIALMMGGGIW